MDRVIAIGDIHGCYRTLKALLYKKIKITKNDEIIFLGDYIDRGPKSKKVLKHILKLIEEEYNITCLMGNHELMLLNSLKSPIDYRNWLRFGGKETLDSFKVLHPKDINPKYLVFLNKLFYFKSHEKFIFVHGGLNFDKKNPLKDLDSMPWIRNSNVDITKIDNKRIIVGHTPYPISEIKKSLTSNRILLDGGCVYSERDNLGYLVALEINKMKLFYQKNIE